MKIDTTDILDLASNLSEALTNLAVLETDTMKQACLTDMITSLDNFIEGAMTK